MAAAGYKRITLCRVPINYKFIASSIQHVSRRLGTQALMQMLAGGLLSFCEMKKCNRTKPGDEKRISPACVICSPMNVEGSLSGMSPVLITRRYHLLDNSPATGR